MVIYVDELLFLNALITWLLLLCARGFLHLSPGKGRLLLGSLCGGITSLTALLPPLAAWEQIGVQLLSALLIGWAAFGGLGKRGFLRGTACFLLGSFLLAGALLFFSRFVTGQPMLLRGGVFYTPFSMAELIALCALCYAVLTALDWIRGRRVPVEELCRVTILGDGGPVQVTARLDTGCRFFDPFTGVPVLVCERRKIASLLPAAFGSPRTRRLPFSALSGAGSLPVYRPQGVRVQRGRETWEIGDCLIAVYAGELGEGDFQALLGPSFLENGVRQKAG